MGKDFFEYVPQLKLAIGGNHKPSIRSIDEAMRRRLHLIPFTVTIPPEKRDKVLIEKLLLERDGILAWAVQGCLEWQRQGLNPPKSVQDATNEYFDDEDTVGAFIEEECVKSPSYRTAIGQLYERCRERGEKRGEFCGSRKWFVQQLEGRGFGKQTRIKGGVRAIAGLELRSKDGLYVHPDREVYDL